MRKEEGDYSVPVVEPIYSSLIFEFTNVKDFAKAIKSEKDYYIYMRGNNPNAVSLAKKISEIENAEETLIVSSGMSAIAMSIFTFLRSDSHVLCTFSPYSWTFRILNKYLRKFHIRTTIFYPNDIENLPDLIRENTLLIYIESPSSMFFEVFDISKISSIAKSANIKVIVDNSYATGIYQKPLKLGADVVVNSLSKHINGHDDVILGSISSSHEIIEKIFYEELMMIGSVPHPIACWLTLRGMETLTLRLQKSSDTAHYIIKSLLSHPKVAKIYHPFYQNKEQVEIAKKQLKDTPGLFSLLLNAKRIEDIYDFVHSLKYFKIGVSWGGTKSLVFPACIFYDNLNEKHTLPWNLVRFYCGMEPPEILLQDIVNALEVL